MVNGVPAIDTPVIGFSNSGNSQSNRYRFGYYRTSDSGSNLFVNGTTTYDPTDCTGTAIGTGQNNTRMLVSAMGTEAYEYTSTSYKTSEYAARLCEDLTFNVNGVTYDDWYLPSKDELDLMYTRLKKEGIGGFAKERYWSSSEYYSDAYDVWAQDFYYDNTGESDNRSRSNMYCIRPIRAF